MTENEAIRILGDTTLCIPLGQAAFVGIEAIKKIQQYRAIGTAEECLEARKKQRGKKPKFINGGISVCLICGAKVLRYYNFCKDCRQAIDVGE